MSRSLKILVADTTDPFFNLATEDWIFRDMDPNTKVLFLWRNDKSVIVGRGQNVWTECRLEELEKDGVHLVRRQSGGGAVYQDLGNTCFTFMSGKEPNRTTKDLYRENNLILLGALRRAGVTADSSGRNDLVVEDKAGPVKISGSAFKESRDRCFHHGTMLMDVDLGRLARYLTPDSKKLESKGIRSVKSRVKNLSELVPGFDHQQFCAHLTEGFQEFHDAEAEIQHLELDSLRTIPQISEYYETLRSWDWVYGKNPQFQHTMKERFSWGGCELHLDTAKGKIRESKLFTDSLHPELLLSSERYLKGKPYSVSGIREALSEHRAAHPDQGEQLGSFYRWIEATL